MKVTYNRDVMGSDEEQAFATHIVTEVMRSNIYTAGSFRRAVQDLGQPLKKSSGRGYFLEISRLLKDSPNLNAIKEYLEQWIHAAPELVQSIDRKKTGEEKALIQMIASAAQEGEFSSLFLPNGAVIKWIADMQEKIENLFRATDAFQERNHEKIAWIFVGTIVQIKRVLHDLTRESDTNTAIDPQRSDKEIVLSIAIYILNEITRSLSGGMTRAITTDKEMHRNFLEEVNAMQSRNYKLYAVESSFDSISMELRNAVQIVKIDIFHIILDAANRDNLYAFADALRGFSDVDCRGYSLPELPRGNVVFVLRPWNAQGDRLFFAIDGTRHQSSIILKSPAIPNMLISATEVFCKNTPRYQIPTSLSCSIGKDRNVHPGLSRRLNPIREDDNRTLSNGKKITEVILAAEQYFRIASMAELKFYPSLIPVLPDIGLVIIVHDEDRILYACHIEDVEFLQRTIGSGEILGESSLAPILQKIGMSVSCRLAAVSVMHSQEENFDEEPEDTDEQWRASVRELFPDKGLAFGTFKGILERLGVRYSKKRGKGGHRLFLHNGSIETVTSKCYRKPNEKLDTGLMIQMAERLGMNTQELLDALEKECGRSLAGSD